MLFVIKNLRLEDSGVYQLRTVIRNESVRVNVTVDVKGKTTPSQRTSNAFFSSERIRSAIFALILRVKLIYER